MLNKSIIGWAKGVFKYGRMFQNKSSSGGWNRDLLRLRPVEIKYARMCHFNAIGGGKGGTGRIIAIEHIQEQLHYYRANPQIVLDLEDVMKLHDQWKRLKCRDSRLAHDVKKFVKSRLAQRDFISSGSVRSGLRWCLMYGRFERKNSVRIIHALALRQGLMEDEWVVSRMIGLYAGTGRLEKMERLFGSFQDKRLTIYNSMIFAYAKTVPEKGEPLYRQMLEQSIAPTTVTFRAVLTSMSHSHAHKPKESLSVLNSMKNHQVFPKTFHCGAVVTAFARKRDPYHLRKAIRIMTKIPVKPDEIMIRSILNFCVGPGKEKPSEEEKKRFRELVEIAQSFVSRLEEEGYRYSVLEQTYRKLEQAGLRWPKGVRKFFSGD